nr:hypothetical protein [Streptomyces sp. GESEQ-35]
MYVAERVTPPQQAAAQARARSEVSASGSPAQWHRVLTLLADISLFVGTRGIWTQEVDTGHRSVR